MNHEGHKLALEVRFISRAFNNSIEGLKGHAPVPAGRAIPVDVNHQVVEEVVLGLGEVPMRVVLAVVLGSLLIDRAVRPSPPSPPSPPSAPSQRMPRCDRRPA